MTYRREYTRAGYEADYTHNLRWRYGTVYGEGTDDSPYRGGGSVGHGYRRAADLGFRDAAPGPAERYDEAYYGRRPGRRRYAPRPTRRAGTAARDYGGGYPYFGSAALVEASQGYPPGDTLTPELYPPGLGWGVGDYGEEYGPPERATERWRRAARSERGRRTGRGRWPDERAGRSGRRRGERPGARLREGPSESGRRRYPHGPGDLPEW